MRKRYVILLILSSFVSLTKADEQPPYSIKDRAVNENFIQIFYDLDKHVHSNDGSSRLQDVIPASSTYSLGSSSVPWAGAHVSTITTTAVVISSRSARPITQAGSVVLYSTATLIPTAELFVLDGAGNSTLLSPHDKDGNWVFYSENVHTGETIYIDMIRFIRSMEKVTGERFILNKRP